MATEAPGDIQQFIRELMNLHGLNQRELARKWGVPEGLVSRLLLGQQADVTLENAQKLVQAFGINPKVLFPEDEGEENGDE